MSNMEADPRRKGRISAGFTCRTHWVAPDTLEMGCPGQASSVLTGKFCDPIFPDMSLVIPPPIPMPQAQPQQTQAVRPELAQLAQHRPVAAQTQRAITGASQGRAADGAKTGKKGGGDETVEERPAAESAPRARPSKNRGNALDIDV